MSPSILSAQPTYLTPARSSSPSEDPGSSEPDRPTAGVRSTDCVHAGRPDSIGYDAVTTPVVNASTFTFASTDELLDFVEGRLGREEYGRYGNPNERVVESKLAALEGAEDAVVYSSGMAAIVGLLMTKLSSGDEIVFFDQCYHRSREFCGRHLAKFGVTTRTVPTGDYAAMESVINPRTKMLVSESPTNPHLTCVDLEPLVELGKRYQIKTLIDGTLATPMNLKPIAYGVDYVWHSATKYLGGHNDLLAGVICGRTSDLEPVRKMRSCLGNLSTPQNLYLLERGLKTFALRMTRHNENGQAVAEFLQDHPRVDQVFYPGLVSHPSHDVAVRQMAGFGGLVTFTLKDATWRETAAVVDAVQLAKIAPSLGGAESLIEQPLVMSYYSYSSEERQRFGIPDNMIRYSCGLEDADDLIADLDQAFMAV
ncbi:MAG: aminotransferase class I/II-fold pyridoxal phosphate-dependent enzyme [Planctomycetota bacterium]